MINKGGARGDAGQLAVYLLRPRNAEVVMVRGTAALDLTAALLEMEERRELTNSRYSVYHAQMNWHADEELRPEDQLKAVQVLEDRLGFTGQPRAVVRHNDKGREHLHVVWSLVDVENERAVRYSHNFRKHEEAAREIERRFELRRVQGAHTERDGQARPERTPDQWEYEQAKRLQGQDPRAWRKSVRDAWERSDNGASLKAAIEDRGLMANGDKRNCFVIVNEHGAILTLNTKTIGARAAEIRAKLADIDRSQLPSVDEAKRLQRDRQQSREQSGQQERTGNTGRGVYDILREESARVAEAFYWDRDKAAQQWETGLHDAAIAFEQSRPRVKQPMASPSRKFTDREFLPIARPSRRFTDRETWLAEKSAERAAQVPENGTTAAALRHVIEGTEQPQQLADALQERGFRLAQATREDTGQPWPSRYAALHATPVREKDDRPAWQKPREGELVAVNSSGHVYRFTERNSGKTRQQLDEYLNGIERDNLPSVNAAKEAARAEQEQARAAWIEVRRVERVEQRAAQIAHHETVQHIGQAYADTQTGPELVAALEQRHVMVGRASEDDATRAKLQRAYGTGAQSFDAGDYVVMNERGQIYKLDATTIHDEENKIMARLAEIDSSALMDVGTLRAWHQEQRQDQLAEPQHDPFMPMQTARAGIRRGGQLIGKTVDLTTEVLDMGGSAARVAVQIFEGMLEGPSHAISGGSEAQKRQANAIAGAREQAKAKRTPPADQGRAPAQEPAPAQPEGKNLLSRLLQQVRDTKKPEPANDDEEKKRRHRRHDRDR